METALSDLEDCKRTGEYSASGCFKNFMVDAVSAGQVLTQETSTCKDTAIICEMREE